jgi:hypothetical protein
VLRFYEGSGSAEIQLLQPSMSASDWAKLKAVAVKLLNQRGHWPAAAFLEENPFEIYEGTNGFGDEFELLYMKAPMNRYLELADLHVDPQGKFIGRLVANAMTEVTRSIRFVAVELDTADGPAPVSSPVLAVTSEVVERSLSDAEHLLASQGATSGVDRIHTAFHGYLRARLDAQAIAYPPAAGVTDLFKLLRGSHPGFSASGPHQQEVDKILRSLANVVDTLNPVRNHGSVAHPNSALLPQAEAMLVINAVRTLLHYVDAKTR